MVQLHLSSGYHGSLEELLLSVERDPATAADLPLAELSEQVLRDAGAGQTPVAVIADAAAHLARLLQLKAQALTPRPELPPVEVAEDEPDPGELARIVEEYQVFKVAAAEFRGREQEGLRSFPRLAPPPALPVATGLGNVTLDRLLRAVTEALARQPQQPEPAMPRLAVTVRERLAALESELTRAGRLNFSAYMRSCRSRIEVIVGFMAVLELIKNGRAHAEQPEPFGDILIVGEPVEPLPG